MTKKVIFSIDETTWLKWQRLARKKAVDYDKDITPQRLILNFAECYLDLQEEEEPCNA